MKVLTDTFKLIKDLGVEVYVTNFHIEWKQYSTKYLATKEQLEDDDFKGISLSKWKKENQREIDLFESSMQSAGVTIIDTHDNLCWEDNC